MVCRFLVKFSTFNPLDIVDRAARRMRTKLRVEMLKKIAEEVEGRIR